MSQSKIALITPLEEANLPGFGGGIPARPGVAPPIHIPPVPPGLPALPDNTLPPGGEAPIYPIFIPFPPRPDAGLPAAPVTPGTPLPPTGPPPVAGHPLPTPPAIWPPLNPGDGVPPGKVYLLVWVVGTDRYRWIVVDAAQPWPPITPPATPK